MKRNIAQLSNTLYDLLVVGGGIYGAWVAWDATLRGLSVALVEKGDFGSGTSSNSLKTIHGGLRYLQHADFHRMRESISERAALMRVAPHLVHPLPFLIPTYGHGLQGKEALFLALLANDLIGFDRNRVQDPQKYLPRGRTISKEDCLTLLPGIDSQGLTGGAIWYDCQLYNSERMILCILQSATIAGADVANYIEVTELLRSRNRVVGVKAKDVLTDEALQIRAKLVVNTSGPWVQKVSQSVDGQGILPSLSFSKAINIVLTRQLFPTYAVGVLKRKKAKDDSVIIDARRQWFFITPWRHCSLVGTLHLPYEGSADTLQATEQDVETLVTGVNAAYPSASLTWDDVAFVHRGLLPAARKSSQNGNVTLLKHHQIIDHTADGMDTFISVVGVKYTTARDVAQKVTNLVFERLGRSSPPCTSAVSPVYGGEIEDFAGFLTTEMARQPHGLPKTVVHRLVHTYGSAYPEVLKSIDPDCKRGRMVENSSVLQTEVIHGIREEMAQRLSDVIFRRTDLGSAGHPGREVIQACAALMAAELQWNRERIRREESDVDTLFASHHAKVPTWSSPLSGGCSRVASS